MVPDLNALFSDLWKRYLDTVPLGLGLERMQAVIPSLALPTPKLRYLVAGTNGKGTTTGAIAQLLQAAGYKTGLYTSPHLIKVNERIAVNGVPISDADLYRLYTSIQHHHLSFFEYLTVIAQLYFAEQQVDAQVLEVGLGGRLCATNAFEPDVSVITSIDYDHMEWLGPTLDHIAAEKAGVMRAGKPVILGSTQPVLLAKAAELGCPVIHKNDNFELAKAAFLCHHDVLPNIELQLPQGRRHIKSFLGQDFLLDVAHNPSAAARLHADLDTKRVCIWASKDTKDLVGIVKEMPGTIWILPPVEQTSSIEARIQAIGNAPYIVAASLEDAIRIAAQHEGKKVIFGGFNIVGNALQIQNLSILSSGKEVRSPA